MFDYCGWKRNLVSELLAAYGKKEKEGGGMRFRVGEILGYNGILKLIVKTGYVIWACLKYSNLDWAVIFGNQITFAHYNRFFLFFLLIFFSLLNRVTNPN